MSKLGLEKEEEPEIKLPTFSGLIIQKAKEVQKKTPTSTPVYQSPPDLPVICPQSGLTILNCSLILPCLGATHLAPTVDLPSLL